MIMVTQLQQTFINKAKTNILTWNFQDIIIGVSWSYLTRTLSFYDHGHPIIAQAYKSAKMLKIDMKFSGYGYEDHFKSFMRPTLLA